MAFGATSLSPRFIHPQRPGGVGRVLTANANPPLRQVGTNYFESLNESQVWINLEPQLAEVGPNPVLLNLTIRFPGRRLERPVAVAFRAQTVCFPTVFPTRVRLPILRFLVDGVLVDLTADKSYQFVPSCSAEGSEDTLVLQAPFAFLRELARSPKVTVQALGFSLWLTPDDLAALRLFVDTANDGLTIR